MAHNVGHRGWRGIGERLGLSAGQNLIKNQAEGVDIRHLRNRIAADLFGCGVLRREGAHAIVVAPGSFDCGSTIFAIPKSSSLAAPSVVTRTLPGFRSRCTTWRLCANCTPSHTWRNSSSLCSIDSVRPQHQAVMLSPSMNSITRYG